MAEEQRSKVRLQRVLADAGVAARRVCERMIEEGRVEVNGATVDRLPAFVDPFEDEIVVDGKRIEKPERPVYVMYYKPSRVLTAKSDDPHDTRSTAAAMVQHPSGARLVPVGAMDFETTGLLLMTNDGEMVNALTHPKYQVPKAYQAILDTPPSHEAIAAIRRGVYVAPEGFQKWQISRRPGSPLARLAAEAKEKSRVRDNALVGQEPSRKKKSILAQRGKVFKAEVIVAGLTQRGSREGEEQNAPSNPRTVIELETLEGRDAMVFYALLLAGLNPKRLIRIGIGPVELKGLPLGSWRELNRMELRALRQAIKQSVKGGAKGVKMRGLERPEEWKVGYEEQLAAKRAAWLEARAKREAAEAREGDGMGDGAVDEAADMGTRGGERRPLRPRSSAGSAGPGSGPGSGKKPPPKGSFGGLRGIRSVAKTGPSGRIPSFPALESGTGRPGRPTGRPDGRSLGGGAGRSGARGGARGGAGGGAGGRGPSEGGRGGGGRGGYGGGGGGRGGSGGRGAGGGRGGSRGGGRTPRR